MKAATLFSGIGAPECAAPLIDWRWCAEIDPFASAVHAARFPGVPNLGDILEVDWYAVEPVDLVVGGPPCQGFSVAGPRGGLADPRGNLSLAYVIAVDAIDPAFCLTENVPGWLSMADNSFGHFLGRMVGADAPLVPARGQRWTDAGVVDGPRRTAAWRICDAQFFGVPQRRRRVFVVAVRGAGNWRCAAALFPQQQGVRRHLAPRREAGERIAACVEDGTAFGGNNRSGPIEVASALNGHGGPHGRMDFTVETFICGTLDAESARHTAGTKAEADLLVAHSLREGMSVRRLTPRECERLQGFPDNWTAIPYRGKPAADGPRYRALGNSMAVPVLRWLLQRIAAFEDEESAA